MAGSLTIRELVTKLGFDVDDKKLEDFEASVDRAKFGLLALAGAAAGAVAGLFAITKAAAGAGEEVKAHADLVGLTVEEYQRYSHAAGLAEVSNEGFLTSLQFLTRNVGDAIRGNKEMRKTFDTLGVPLTDAAGRARTTGDILRDLMGRMSAIEDPSLRASLAVDLFGRSGARMGRFIAQGREEIDRANRVVEAFGFFTEEAAESGDAFGDSFEEVFVLVRGIRNEIGTKLFPTFKRVTDAIVDWTLANRDVIRSGLDRFAKLVAKGLDLVFRAGVKVGQGLGVAIRALGGLENVARLAGLALAGLFTASVVQVIMTGISLLRSLAAAGFLAQLGTLGLPIAIAVLAAVVGLLFEEIYGWVTGADSLLGDWLGTWEEFRDRALAAMGPLAENFVYLAEAIKTTFSGLWDGLAGAFGMLVALWRGDLDGFAAAFKRWAQGIGSLIEGPIQLALGIVQTALNTIIFLAQNAAKVLTGVLKAVVPPGIEKLLAMAEGIGGKVRAGAGALVDRFQGLLPEGPTPALAGFTGGAANPGAIARSSVVNNASQPVTYQVRVNAPISVPPGTPAQQAASLRDAVAGGVGDGLLRNVGHTTQAKAERE